MNAKGQNVSPNLDAQIFVYSDASNEGYGGYVSYFDSVFGNASVKDGRQPVESICVDSYSDVVKVDHRLYGNMSDRIMVCSECTGSHFVTEDDFWHVNEDMPEINQVHESDVVLESDVALIGAGGGGRVVRWSWVNFQCRGVLLVSITVGQGPTALAVGAGGGCLDIFTLIYPFSPLSPSLWETTRYRLNTVSKGR